MIYNINKVDKVKILGKTFVENNKKICTIVQNNQDIELTEELDVKDINEDKLVLKLIGINNIKTMNSMFYQCDLLEELPGLGEFDTNQIYDMSYLFYGCSSLKSLPDITKWDISNVVNMECMFYECSS
jgi:surface protein